ncbi:hypothetical protein ACH5RR_018932 [Cinchona calisaya]|uniref:Uncharacterized protein n=1 Tax=Cinchona calisaya TaxID=153742 RepID=A0ABD2ZNE3_9GENT
MLTIIHILLSLKKTLAQFPINSQKPLHNLTSKPKIPPKPLTKLPNNFRKVSLADFAKKKLKVLCFKYDEPYTFGHIYKKSHLNFILAEEGEDLMIEEGEKKMRSKRIVKNKEGKLCKYIYNLGRWTEHKTIRIKGAIKGR